MLCIPCVQNSNQTKETNDARHENRDYLEGVGSFCEEGILGRGDPGS